MKVTTSKKIPVSSLPDEIGTIVYVRSSAGTFRCELKARAGCALMALDSSIFLEPRTSPMARTSIPSRLEALESVEVVVLLPEEVEGSWCYVGNKFVSPFTCVLERCMDTSIEVFGHLM